ncbi:MAG TPA: (Fe-S)-binding protein [Verrucomicrobiae bacterium]|nr:(Fe-S)-binding protein [Verrucomicrobiae bacterium]
MHINDHTSTIEACRFCFMCRHVCTVGIVSGRESDTPRGRGLILSKIQKGYIAYDEDLVETVYRCCLCGMCETWCKAGCTPPTAALAARADIVAKGMAPERVRRIRENLVGTGNPFGLPPRDRFKAIAGGNGLPERADVLYYVGCDAAYRQPEVAGAFIKILRAAGIEFSLLADERSTGKALSILGYRDDARAAAESLVKKIRASACKVLVTTCPSSYDAFKSDYPAMGLDLSGIEILHASQYLDRLLSEKRIAPRRHLAAGATLLDGTYLGRHHGIFEEPRRVLATVLGSEHSEMIWSREMAHAAGEAGGVFQLLHPELSLGLAARVLDQAAQAGASVLAVTCPATKAALLAADRDGMQVRDIVELVADGL